MKKIIVIIMILISQVTLAITGNEILNKVDELGSLDRDTTAKVKLTIKEKGQGIKVEELLYYRKDSADSFLIVFTAPSNERGNGYLKNGDNIWLYKKNTRTFQFVNSNEVIGSSRATAEDFEEKKLADMYNVVKDKSGKEIIEEVKLGNKNCYKIEVKAKNNKVKNPKRIYWIDKESFLPLQVENYSLSGKLTETIQFGSYKKIENSYISTKLLITDEFDNENKTLVEISNISTEKIPDKIFTKAYLENLNK